MEMDVEDIVARLFEIIIEFNAIDNRIAKPIEHPFVYTIIRVVDEELTLWKALVRNIYILLFLGVPKGLIPVIRQYTVLQYIAYWCALRFCECAARRVARPFTSLDSPCSTDPEIREIAL
jgi:hypothetical protein